MSNSLSKHRLVIIGAGPAGLSAAIYAGRSNLTPLVFSGGEVGGQLLIMADIENYPGFKNISGPELAQILKDQAVECGATISPEAVTAIDLNSHPFKIWTQLPSSDLEQFSHLRTPGQILKLTPAEYKDVAIAIKTQEPTHLAESVIIATGARRQPLGLVGEEELVGRGISYCATCDGPFFRGKDVAVVGGGNAAIEELIRLSDYARQVHLIHFEETFSRSDKSLQEQALALPNVVFHWLHTAVALDGRKKLEQVIIQDQAGIKKTLAVNGLFIAIGTKPNSVVFSEQLTTDRSAGLVIESNNHTSIPGVFAAGDVISGIFKQIIIAGASGAAATRAVENFLANSSA